eukprot:3819004-Rhodomonas_salina.1
MLAVRSHRTTPTPLSLPNSLPPALSLPPCRVKSASVRGSGQAWRRQGDRLRPCARAAAQHEAAARAASQHQS